MRAGRIRVEAGSNPEVPAEVRRAVKQNALLRSLSPRTLNDFLKFADLISLPKHEVIYNAGSVGDWVYFPTRGVLSGFASGMEGAPVQAMLIGPDGVVGGLRAVLGIEVAKLSIRVTIPGEALALRLSAVRALARRHSDFREAIEHCALRLLLASTQYVLCARLHTLVERASTWLLVMSHYSTPQGVVRLTHEELAEIVGASRPSLSVIISELAEQGTLEPSGRGRILIDDRESLSERACECWSLFIDRSLPENSSALDLASR